MHRILIVSQTAGTDHPPAQDDYHVDTSTSVAQALDLIPQSSYDLIFLDITLPDGSGLELIHSLRAIQPTSLIVLVADPSDTGSAIDGVLAGASDFLFKPLTSEKVQQMIAQYLTVKTDPASPCRELVMDDSVQRPIQPVPSDDVPSQYAMHSQGSPRLSVDLDAFVPHLMLELCGVEAIIGLGIAIAGINVMVFALSQTWIDASWSAVLTTTGSVIALLGVQVVFLSYLFGSLRDTVAAYRRTWLYIMLAGLLLIGGSIGSMAVVSSPPPVMTVRITALMMGVLLLINTGCLYRRVRTRHR